MSSAAPAASAGSSSTYQSGVDECHVVRQAGGPYPLSKVAAQLLKSVSVHVRG